MTKPLDDLEAVRQLVETLTPFDNQDRERIIRWAREKLGITSEAATAITEGPKVAAASEVSEVLVRSLDIKTFVESKKPKSDMQFAAVVAYYYRFETEQSLRRTTITADILQEAARLSARKRLKHPAFTLKNAKNQGYLDSQGKGEFSINTVGENLVAMTLPGGEARSNSSLQKMPPKNRTAKR